MKLNRRTFLSLTAGLSASHIALAAPTADKQPDSRFLLVFLRGGYDAMSLLVPTQSDFYRETRPHIALRAEGAQGAMPLDAQWALHPAVAAKLQALWAQKQLAFIPFAGTSDTSRSHFETQDSIELGQPLDHQRDFNSGFLNRLAQQLQSAHSPGNFQAMSFTDQLPTVFRGPASIPNLTLKGKLGKDMPPRMQNAVAEMYAHHPLGSQVQEGFEVRDQVMQDFAAEMDAASRRAINASAFEGQARKVARLMRERYALGFIDVGGWDTHVNQGVETGYLATQLGNLAQGLSALSEELGDAAWQKTTVVVISEFGRTLRENGNRGTDHGHGSVYWVLGGGIRGGRVVGEQQTIEASTLFQNRDLPVLNDYRSVLGGLFQRQFGLSGPALGNIFPQARPIDLGLI
ncbi:MAG: DUF1501 domain-containing protein [Burkholderiales bacterium]|nr:DUF1501 domain-containing protein [Burkholderiales bacterium]MDE2433515.1 DUF1501 domain-containing protein [Burkholderiales bacterium]